MLEVFRQKGIEALFLTDPNDEYSFQQLKDYNNHKMICITKENVKLIKQRMRKQHFKHAKANFKRLEESSKASFEKISKMLEFPRDCLLHHVLL
jgi:molecular chaperone HtpG